MMLHHYFFCFIIFHTYQKRFKKFFVKKNKTFWYMVCCFAHPYDFRAWLDSIHDSAKTSRLKQKNKICSSSILYWLSRHVAFFLAFFGNEKKVSELNIRFLDRNFMLWLFIIIEQNKIFAKSYVTPEALIHRVSVSNFKSIR